ncbi:hypothetical protein BCR32DRAFT_190621, partial [Anaeromyces robustus]
STNDVKYRDKDGKWGFENGNWCIIYENNEYNESNKEKTYRGYPYCKSTNDVRHTDEDGKWGLENDKWCFISDNNKYE